MSTHATLGGLLSVAVIFLTGGLATADAAEPTLSFTAERPLQFDGSGDYVNLGSAAELNPTEAVTLELWFKITGSLDGARYTLLRRSHDGSGEFSGTHSGNNCYHIEVRDDRVRIRFKQLSVYGEGTIEKDKWTHLALTYDPAEQRVRMYRDGEQVLDTEWTEPLATAERDTVIGARKYGDRTTGHTEGQIRDVRLWNRARSQDAIRRDMNQRLRGDEPGLAGYWRLDEGEGDRVRDRSPHGNDGTIVGGTWQDRSVPDLVRSGEAAVLYVQVRDENGRPVSDGVFEDVIAADAGTLEPETVTIEEGESDTRFTWRHEEPGGYTLVADHADLGRAVHDIEVEGTLVLLPETQAEPLVAWWPIVEGEGDAVADYSGHERHGYLGPDGADRGPVWVADRADSAGGALHFDGEEAFVRLPAPMTFDADRSFTVSVWAMPTAGGGGLVTKKSSYTDNPGWSVAADRVLLEDDTGRENQVRWSRFELNADAWNHVALVVDREAQAAEVFINGEGQGEQDISHLGSFASDVPVHLGRWGHSHSRFWYEGAIDDVQIHARALTAAEIGQLFEDTWWRQQSAVSVVESGRPMQFRVQVRDDDGRPVSSGAYEDIISVEGGTLEPETVSIAAGESEARFTWTHDTPGSYRIIADHAALAALSHGVHVGVLDALADESETVRTEALHALESIGIDGYLAELDEAAYGRAFALLIDMLEAEDSETWQAAFQACRVMVDTFAQRGDANAIGHLRTALREAPSARLRSRAARALAGLPTDDAARADLRSALDDADWRVRVAAGQTLEEAGEPVAIDAAEGAADWPTWRREVSRGAATEHALGDELHLQWVRELPEPQRAWLPQDDDGPSQKRSEPMPEQSDNLAFDGSYDPVAADGLLFVPSMITESVTAYDIDSGEQRWRYYTDGPVRVAPAVYEGRVYVASDDGYVHCLDAESGERIWRFRAAPGERQVLGNERLISMWPVRGGPAIKDGLLYFTAGIWPHEGVFIYALDADSGELVWRTSGMGSTARIERGFSAIVPQGALAIHGDRIVLPGGKVNPTVRSREDGSFVYPQQWGKVARATVEGWGGYGVFAHEQVFGDHGVVYDMETGSEIEQMFIGVVDDDVLFGIRDGAPFAWFPAARDEEDRLEWDAIDGAELDRLHLKAGSTLYASGPEGEIYALGLPEMQLKWSAQVNGDIFRMLAADDRLFVVTEDGRIHCFGPERRDAVVHAHQGDGLESAGDAWADRAARLLERSGAREGYALMFGVGSGRLLHELVAQSDLHIVAFDPDPQKVDALRRQFSEAGVYGERVSVRQGNAMSQPLPPYIASLVVSESPADAGLEMGEAFAEAMFHPLRPYGGTMYLALTDAERPAFAEAFDGAELENAELERIDDATLVTRPGPLPGADSWTHEYSDAANTTYSADRRVKAPLGIAWFGGPTNHRVLPRHGNGPVPHVVAGRLIIMGPDHLTARCVYTGREMWQVELPGVGRYFTNLRHQPGSIFMGSPYVSTPDSVYIMHEDRCLRLDLDTGEELAAFEMPEPSELRGYLPDPDAAREPSYAARVAEEDEQRWGYVSVSGDYLVAGAYPHTFDDRKPGNTESWNLTSSEYLVVMDRRSGEVQWARQAQYGYRHNAIISSSDRSFVIDNLSDGILTQLSRRGIEPGIQPRIQAFDLETGGELWSYDDHVFGTRLAYSEAHDVLLQGGTQGYRHNVLPDEPQGQTSAIRGSNGGELWRREVSHTGAAALHDDLERIIASGNERALNMLTGEEAVLDHPTTDIGERWRWIRSGSRCGTQNVSRYLITFRASTAAFHDLHTNAGTVHIPGFRSGCTNNLIAADGILNAPDYTRTCGCPYPHQTSLGMVHMPESTMWAYNSFSDPEPGTIRRAGINFGAPGVRVADNGVMWTPYPGVSRVPAPQVPIEVDAADEAFTRHAMEIEQENDGHRWIAATGLRDVSSVRIAGLYNDGGTGGDGASYALRLHFAEPERIEAGERVFDVRVQGETVIEALDVVAETGGPDRVFVAEINGVGLGDGDAVHVELVSDGDGRGAILCGIELSLED